MTDLAAQATRRMLLEAADTAAGLIAPVGVPDYTPVRRFAVVAAVNPGTVPTVNLTVGSATVPGVRFLDSYRPVVGDTVVLDLLGSDPLVIGTVASTSAAHAGTIVQEQTFGQFGGSASSNSTTYLSIYNAVSITKLFANSYLRVTVGLSCYATVAVGLVTIGALINGTDYDVAKFFFNELGSHRHFTGFTDLGGVLIPAGAQTVQGRIKVAAGTTWSIDSNDSWWMKVAEVLM